MRKRINTEGRGIVKKPELESLQQGLSAASLLSGHCQKGTRPKGCNDVRLAKGNNPGFSIGRVLGPNVDAFNESIRV